MITARGSIHKIVGAPCASADRSGSRAPRFPDDGAETRSGRESLFNFEMHCALLAVLPAEVCTRVATTLWRFPPSAPHAPQPHWHLGLAGAQGLPPGLRIYWRIAAISLSDGSLKAWHTAATRVAVVQWAHQPEKCHEAEAVSGFLRRPHKRRLGCPDHRCLTKGFHVSKGPPSREGIRCISEHSPLDHELTIS